MMPRHNPPTKVYFIRQGITGPVKIGVATDVVKRLRQLQTNQPIPLRIIRVLDGDKTAERALHKRFATHRLKGEWFTFVAEMAAGDLGFADLPIPLVRRHAPSYPENAYGRERCLHAEILAAIGGVDTLARRLRLAPWVVAPLLIEQRYWSAAVLLLNDAGRHDICVETLFAAREAVNEENKQIQDHNARIAAEQRKSYLQRQEDEWISKHGASSAWWTLTPIPAATEVAA